MIAHTNPLPARPRTHRAEYSLARDLWRWLTTPPRKEN